jgi:hypothetical protein
MNLLSISSVIAPPIELQLVSFEELSPVVASLYLLHLYFRLR